MTNIPSLAFPELPTITTEVSVPSGGEGEGQPFCDLLASLSSEVEGPGAAEVEILPVDSIVCLPIENGGEGDLEAGDDAEQDPDADMIALSSCLAMWQNLPPVTPVQTAIAGEKVDCENFFPAGGESDRPAAINAHSPTPDAVRSVPIQETQAQPKESSRFGMPLQDSTAQPRESAAGEPAVAMVPTAQSMEVAVREPMVAVESPVAPAEPLRAAVPPGRIDRPAISSDSKTLSEIPIIAEVPRAVSDGIPDAKEQRAMTEIVSHRFEKGAPAPFAAGETEFDSGRFESDQTSGSVVPLREQLSQDETNEGAMDGHGQSDARDRYPAVAGIELPTEFEISESEGKPVLESATQVIEHIERTIERMRSHGSQRLEMRLPLRDGEEVVVKLRIEHGEVRATFQSASEGLRQALETGWSLAAQTSPERAARALPAVFESPSMQSGMGSFQQSPNQRERENHEPNGEPAFRPLASPVERPRVSEPRRPNPTAGSSVTLKLYA